MGTINSKADMYELYFAGAFGNTLVNWRTYEEFKSDLDSGKWPAEKPVALRTATKPGVIPPRYCVRTETWEVLDLIEEWVVFGIPRETININELGKDHLITLQGEVMRSTNYFDLRGSYAKTVMRTALATNQFHLSGLWAYLLIHQKMDAPSWDNLNRLFDEYPDSIIEFTVYGAPVGDLGWNTVFWEVRNY